MRVFVTGASGFIGSALTADLIAAGHEVVGLARSDESADALTAAGAEVRRGSLHDLDSLRDGAADADAVAHLAYVHDFDAREDAAATDRAAIETLGDALVGSDRPFVIASGTLGLPPGRVGTERDGFPVDSAMGARAAAARLALDYEHRGVRSSVVRLAPSVHDRSKRGFLGVLVDIARDKGAAAYIGDGSNRWTGVHVLDAARLFRLVIEQAPAGSVWHGVADEGIPVREIAEVISRHLDVPLTSIPSEQTTEHFGWMGAFIGTDSPASSTITQETLAWRPTGPGLLDDLENGQFFE